MESGRMIVRKVVVRHTDNAWPACLRVIDEEAGVVEFSEDDYIYRCGDKVYSDSGDCWHDINSAKEQIEKWFHDNARSLVESGEWELEIEEIDFETWLKDIPERCPD